MKKVVVLGAGQLARYLVLESHSLPIQVITVGGSTESAALINPNHKAVQLDDLDGLKPLIESADLVTFESEFVHKDFLQKLAAGYEEKFFPSTQLIGTFQDRKFQKEALIQAQVPTLPYLQPSTVGELEKLMSELGPFVMKARFGGYDGYGTFIFRKKEDLQLAPRESDLNRYICEPYFSFRRELAITFFRSADGSLGHYPFVEWKAKDNKCFWVKGPAKVKAGATMISKISRMLKKLDYVGAFSAEFFEDAKGQLFVNEVAPRVHNSCHYSLSATTQSQFYTHLLCGLGAKLPKQIESYSKGFAMVNILGTSESQVRFPQNKENTWVFDYQKAENRPGRKLGHINSVGRTADEALDYSLKAERKCQK